MDLPQSGAIDGRLVDANQMDGKEGSATKRRAHASAAVYPRNSCFRGAILLVLDRELFKLSAPVQKIPVTPVEKSPPVAEIRISGND